MRMFVLIALLVSCSGCVVWYKDFPRPAMTAGQQGTTDAVLPAHPGFERCVFLTGESESEANFRAAGDALVRLTPFDWYAYPFYPITSYLGLGHGLPYHAGIPRLSSGWYVLHRNSLNMEMPVQGGTVVFASDLSETGVMPQEELACQAGLTFTLKFGLQGFVNGLASGLTFTIVPFLGLPDTVEYYVRFFVSNPQGLTREYPYRFRKAGISGVLVLPFAWINLFTSTEKEAFQAVFQQFLFDLQRDRAARLPERSQSPTR